MSNNTIHASPQPTDRLSAENVDDRKPLEDVQQTSLEVPNNGAHEADTEDFPEGGYGWVVVAGTFIIMGLTFGMINSYGEYQKYYFTKFPHESQSMLTLVGSLQPFMIYIFSIPAAVLYGQIGPRKSILLAAVLQSFSFMMTSLCTKLWQLALAQGVLFGIGPSILILVAYSVPQQWFKKRRATAIGFVSSGSSIGGVLWPLAVQHLIAQVGFPWANRIIGFIYLPLLVISAFIIRTREHEMHDPAPPGPDQVADEEAIESEKDEESFNRELVVPVPPHQKHWIRRNIFHSQFMIDWTVLGDMRFNLILIANFIGFFTLFVPLFFLPSYTSLVNISPSIGNNILTIINCASILGRILPGILGDKIGRLNTFIISATSSGVVVIALWLPAKNDAVILVLALLFGLSSGAFVALPPAVIGQLFGLKGIKSRISLYMLACAPGSLAGTVIAGTFLPTTADHLDPTKGYDKLIIFSGVLFLGCAFFLVVARLCFSRKLFAFV